MKREIQNLIVFLKLPFPYLCIVGSLATSGFLLSIPDFEKSIYHLDEEITEIVLEKRKQPHEGEKFEFGCNPSCAVSPDPPEFIANLLLLAIGAVLVMPSFLATVLFLSSVEFWYPNIHPTSMYPIAIGSFIYFHANYWLMLAYLLYSHGGNRGSVYIQTIFSKPQI